MSRFKRVSIYSDQVAWKEQAVLDTEQNRVAPFGQDDPNDDLLDVIEWMEAGHDEIFKWTPLNRVRIDDSVRPEAR